MSKVKSSAIPKYELLYLIPNKYSEDEVPAIIEKVSKIITDHEGKVEQTEDWGKKKLAYPIKGYVYGYYHLTRMSLPGSKINEIDQLIQRAPEVLRHIIIKDEGRVEKKVRTRVKEAGETAMIGEKEKALAEEKETKKDAAKVDLKDLDDKLDKILEGGDLLK
ncbi:MAG: 30S ribosomal protein S6 [Patescibacteria group bacterium]|jgi:small subunit ribosomal protein S6